MQQNDRNECHITNTQNGHLPTVDCWCEPVKIWWVVNRYGIKVLVVEHHDMFNLKHRLSNIVDRETTNDWITKLLKGIRNGPPLLPPQNPFPI